MRYSFDIYGEAVRKLQEDDYYAFGLRHAATGGTNKYLYNGKELQDELGQYDYGARFYDPVVGRFNTIDPVAEHFPWMTNYQYASNNPSTKIDLDGLEGVMPPSFFFENSAVIPKSSLVETASRYSVENLAKAGGEIGGKPVAELVGKASEMAGKSTQDHHWIPRQFKNNEVVEAAREGGFKFEGAENLSPLEKFSRLTGEGQHGNHPGYNKGIGEKLGEFAKNNPEYSTSDAVKFVRALVKQMQQEVANNPAAKVNDIFRVVLPADNTTVAKKLPQPVNQ